MRRQVRQESHIAFESSADFNIIKEFKEQFCYIPLHLAEQQKKVDDPNGGIESVQAELPDGDKIMLRKSLYMAPEIMFQPSLIGRDIHSVQELVIEAIKKSDIDLRAGLYQSITLSGGNTMINGFQERLNYELANMVSDKVKIKIIAPIERKFSVWIGGSVLATLATFQSSWITKEEYQEFGAPIVHRKCL